jgi:hypothetical protein
VTREVAVNLAQAGYRDRIFGEPSEARVSRKTGLLMKML